MRQPPEDRALYYRQLRETIRRVFAPELTSAQAIDAAGLVDRILAEFIVEEEAGPALSTEFGGAFEELLDPDGGAATAEVTTERFHELRRDAAALVARTANSADAEERDLGRRVAAVERRFLERLDELRGVALADIPPSGDTTGVEGCSVTCEQITTYLRSRLPDSPNIVAERISLVPGGRSKETILVSLSGTAELPHDVILRKDRPVSVMQTRAVDEFAVIKAVYDYGGVPVPQPFLAEIEGHGLGDGTLLVMERVPGHKAGEYFPDLAAPARDREKLGVQLAASLARLHSMPLECIAKTSLDPRGGAVSEEGIAAAVDGMVARINELTGPPCATVPLARQWLLDHVRDVVPASRPCVLWGDLGFHNMLVDDGRITALLDWEAAAVGPPARELAAAWNAVITLLPWPMFVDAYVEAGGPVEATDPSAIAYYRVFAALGGFMTSRLGGHLFRTGAKRDLLTAHSGLDSHFRCQRNLARALSDAMSSTSPA